MSVRNLIMLVIAVVLFGTLLGCVTDPRLTLAKDAVERQDWDTATENAIEALSENPKSKTAASLLKKSLPNWYAAHSEAGQRAAESQSWDEAVRQADMVREVSAKAAKLSPDLAQIPAPDMQEMRGEAAAEAAVIHYQNAVDLEAEAKFKDAAKEFKVTYTLQPTYLDARQRYDQNREKAMQKVIVLTFADPASGASPGIGQAVTAGIGNEVRRSVEMQEFMRLVPMEEFLLKAQEQGLPVPATLDVASATRLGKATGIHALVLGNVNSVYTNYPPESMQSFSRNATVTIYYKNADGSTGSYQKQVYATVNHYERSAEATTSASYKIVDVNQSAVVKEGEYTGQVVENFKWARFSGDQAALNSGDKALAREPEGRPKPPQQNIAVAASQVIKNFSENIAFYFNQ